jgi:hypothetical protein
MLRVDESGIAAAAFNGSIALLTEQTLAINTLQEDNNEA